MRIERELLEELFERVTERLSVEDRLKLYLEFKEETDMECLSIYLSEKIDDICDSNHYCPHCGEELIPVVHYEVHMELDYEPLEPCVDHYTCEWCGEDFE